MKARAYLQQGRYAAPQPDATACRLSDPAQNLEEGALAGAVAADDSEPVAGVDFEADILKSVELLAAGRGSRLVATE